ncbi:hypothetical protein N7510_000338 [Penicillium lagena]|uniref:uncharacterized protein n=1 Tax=Penicillium lagena TaxID=94218 RepID=UPI00254158CB|nr:uncharacterized protein N7510_000338 [Penicillium lagena]KAJ5624029.1 hypothetical protein N7510_000338 [Penicillium lagena]
MSIPSSPKLDGLDIIQTTYKKIGDHEIRTDILIPQTPHKGQRPVIIRFHGGGFVFGDSLYMDFYPHWLSDLAITHGAVVISPNYRLIPEASSTDIHDDMEDFWTWMHSSALADLLAAHTTPTAVDLDRVLTFGESAGGTLSINLALSHPSEIRACTAAYPCVDLQSPDYHTPREKPPFGHNFPKEIVQKVLSSTVPGTPVSSITEQERLVFLLSGMEYGEMGGLWDKGVKDSDRARVYTFEKLELPDCSLPRGGIAIIQGAGDSVVPARGAEKFVHRAREVFSGKLGGDHIVFTLRDGDHGFDGDARYSEEWLQDTLKVAVETWLE